MKIQFTILLILVSQLLGAQIPDGSSAPDFTVTDINGIEYNLYDILAEDKSVIIDFSATWCAPCWAYHMEGTLKNYYELYGPEGTNESMVFMIESDFDTDLNDLQQETNNSYGDWVTGTNFPIVDDASIRALFNVYQYPSVMMICPDRSVKMIGQAGVSSIYNHTQTCPGNEVAPEVDFWADSYQGCNGLEVQFFDNSWPTPEQYLWDFGDGTTSTEVNPSHSFPSAGTYTVSLQATNSFGENTIIKENLISVGEGLPLPIQNVGPFDNSIGSGKFFAGGQHGLIFNAFEPFTLSSVKVFSEVEAERIIVILDENANLIHRKTVMVPAGEYRIPLEMYIPQGSGYTISLHSNAFLYRNNSGVNFPYSIDGLVSITTSTAAGNYYYFYDWEVRSAGCDNSTTSSKELTSSAAKVYPVPVRDRLMIESTTRQHPKVFNSLGQEVQVSFSLQSNGWSIDFSGLNNGIYFIQLGDQIIKVPKQ